MEVYPHVVVLGFWEVCRQEDFMQLENETVFNEAVIEEKEQGIREIHQQIGEVNEIFKDLAVLVHEQCYMIGSCEHTHTQT